MFILHSIFRSSDVTTSEECQVLQLIKRMTRQTSYPFTLTSDVEWDRLLPVSNSSNAVPSPASPLSLFNA